MTRPALSARVEAWRDRHGPSFHRKQERRELERARARLLEVLRAVLARGARDPEPFASPPAARIEEGETP